MPTIPRARNRSGVAPNPLESNPQQTYTLKPPETKDEPCRTLIHFSVRVASEAVVRDVCERMQLRC